MSFFIFVETYLFFLLSFWEPKKEMDGMTLPRALTLLCMCRLCAGLRNGGRNSGRYVKRSRCCFDVGTGPGVICCNEKKNTTDNFLFFSHGEGVCLLGELQVSPVAMINNGDVGLDMTAMRKRIGSQERIQRSKNTREFALLSLEVQGFLHRRRTRSTLSRLHAISCL